jgi:hypothetical protein
MGWTVVSGWVQRGWLAVALSAACGRVTADDASLNSGGRLEAGAPDALEGGARGGDAQGGGGRAVSSGGSAGQGGAAASGEGGSGSTGRGGSFTGASANGGASQAGAAGAGGADEAPLRVIVFYTRWGTSYPEWMPIGAGPELQLGSLLAPLEPFVDRLLVVSGLSNARINPVPGALEPLSRTTISDQPADGPLTLLTARDPIGERAGGPSLETVVGDCGDAALPPVRLMVGRFISNQTVGFDVDGGAIEPEPDPQVAAARWLGHPLLAPNPDLAYPSLGAAQMDVLVEALARRRVCAGTLLWGDDFVPSWLGLEQDMHTLSHRAPGLFAALSAAGQSPPPNPFATLQRWYATQFAALLGKLQSTPFDGRTLFDRSVVLWISESGAGSEHGGMFIPVVIAGGGGRLNTGRWIVAQAPTPEGLTTVQRTQGDLLSALATLWGIANFGDPVIASRPLREILAAQAP